MKLEAPCFDSQNNFEGKKRGTQNPSTTYTNSPSRRCKTGTIDKMEETQTRLVCIGGVSTVSERMGWKYHEQ
jgi:hypothetical protein